MTTKDGQTIEYACDNKDGRASEMDAHEKDGAKD